MSPSISPAHQVQFGPDLFWLRLWQGDALEVLRQVPSNSVHCWMTSPPYWRLRDYGWEGQLGHERTLREHIAQLVLYFRELRRTLHPSGALYVNYGDTYAQGGKSATSQELASNAARTNGKAYATSAFAGYTGQNRAAGTTGEFARKQLLMIPHRLAMALQDDGWWVRADIVWSKPNPLPESTSDRPSKGITQRQLAHELGIDHTIVCHIETARKHVTREMAADIGELFDEPQTAMAAAGYIPFVGWKP